MSDYDTEEHGLPEVIPSSEEQTGALGAILEDWDTSLAPSSAESDPPRSNPAGKQSAPRKEPAVRATASRRPTAPRQKPSAVPLSPNYFAFFVRLLNLDDRGPIGRTVGSQVGTLGLLLVLQFGLDLFAWTIAFGWAFGVAAVLPAFIIAAMVGALDRLIITARTRTRSPWVRIGFGIRAIVALALAAAVAVPMELHFMESDIDQWMSYESAGMKRRIKTDHVALCEQGLDKEAAAVVQAEASSDARSTKAARRGRQPTTDKGSHAHAAMIDAKEGVATATAALKTKLQLKKFLVCSNVSAVRSAAHNLTEGLNTECLTEPNTCVKTVSLFGRYRSALKDRGRNL